MPPKRMTANPVRPARYRPGKPTGNVSSESSSESEASEGEDQQQQKQAKPTAPPPKATSFAHVNLDARRRAAEAQDAARRRQEAQERERMEREAGFVTESSGESDESEDESSSEAEGGVRLQSINTARTARAQESDEDSSSEESSSSSESDRPVRLRPTFIKKNQRGPVAVVADPYEEAEAKQAALESRRRQEAEALIRERIEQDAAARAAGRKGWDDDEGAEDEIPDDKDGVDPELERTQWIARELGRLRRARAALEEREAEIQEVERRRGLTAAEREREDQEYLAEQADRKKERGQMAPLQKYHHKGAFFTDEAKDLGLLDRNIMGARFEDQVAGGGGNTAGVPEYLQVRDATMIGRKGRTRYKDLKSEDTGRWNDGFDSKGRSSRKDYGDVRDERFRADYSREGPGATGANASAIGQKRARSDHVNDRDDKRSRAG